MLPRYCAGAGEPSGAYASFIISPARIDAVFQDFGPTTPGCALGIYSAGRVLYLKGYGMADLDHGVPITPETVFDIGSTSKQFTAAAILLLADEGKLSLRDDVRRYIPELPAYGGVITIDNLLHHTSGLRDYDGLLFLAGHYVEDYTGDDDALAIITSQKALNFEPGSRWSYSNTGYFLLALIVKRVTGLSLADFAKARLFDPLGMRVTNFRTDHTAVLKNRAVAYAPRSGGGFSIEMSNWDQIGDGGINTNVLDLERWDANFYDPRVGGRALVDQLQQRAVLDDGEPTEYGRGLFLDAYRGLTRVEHGGAWAGYRAMLMRFPDQKLSIALTCNVSNADAERRADAVADVVLEPAFTRAEKAPGGASAYAGPKLDLEPLAGDYVGAQSLLRIGVENGSPVLKAGKRVLHLKQVGPRRFAAPGTPLTIEFAEDGQTFALDVRGEKDPAYRRVARYSPSPAEIEALAGRYHSPELGTDWTIRVDKGVAYVKGRAIGEVPLEPVTKDVWTSGLDTYAFTRGINGRIMGFSFTSSRTTRIRFDR